MADVILRAPLMGSMALVARKALNVCLKSAKQLIRKLLAPQYTARSVNGSLHRSDVIWKWARQQEGGRSGVILAVPTFSAVWREICEMWSSVKYEAWDVLCKALKLNDNRTSSTTQVARASSRTKAPLNI